MFNLGELFKKSKDNRKDKLLGHLKEENKPEEFQVDLNEEFIEQPTTISAQFQKAHLSFLEFIDVLKSHFVPNELFILEVLDESVSVGIITKKAVFLDIKYLKKYTYEELHQSYQKIIGKTVEYDRSWYESIENIITIVSYETIYSIPQKVVIVDTKHSDFIKVSTKTGRFKDKKVLKNIIKKEFEMASGYKEEDIYKHVAQRAFIEKKEDQTIYVVSMVEKEYFDKINKYFNDSDLTIKRFHSIKSSLYASFFVQDKKSKMRVHVMDSIAYVMEKHRESGFEYQQINLDVDTTGLELVGYTMDEVILSGSGEYYEKLKKQFVEADIKVRTFNYVKDLNRCIIRLEQGVKLDNSFATVVGVAYHELFKINFSTIRLGVSKNMTIYEIMYNNLNVLPFFILLVVVLGTYGLYTYLEYEYKNLQEKHLGTTKLVNEEKKLNDDIRRYNANLQNTKNRIKKIEDLFSNKVASIDALVLHEVAQKLPDDMIIIKIEKKTIKNKLNHNIEVIQVTGKCFQEKSLLEYIKSLHIENKKVFLVKLNDSKKLKFGHVKEEEKSIFTQLQQSFNLSKNLKALNQNVNNETKMAIDTLMIQNEQQVPKKVDQEKLKEIQKMNLEEKEVYFSDTLNNTFTLEIK